MRTSLVRMISPAILAVTFAMPVVAQEPADGISLEQVHVQIAEAMLAVAAYSVQERQKAIDEANAALEELDAALTSRKEAMRERFAEMAEEARTDLNQGLAELEARRIELARRLGMLEAGADAAWAELLTGFEAAWTELSDSIDESGLADLMTEDGGAETGTTE